MRSAIKTGVVPEFSGEYFFLSNFYQEIFTWRAQQFFCAEQAFQYAKTWYPKKGETLRCKDLGKRLIDTGNGATAKKYGREVPVDLEFWNAQRVPLMREIIHAKFSTPGSNLAGQLINTGAMLLVEGNTWGDVFWGRSRNADGKIVGLNTLGTILMEERGYWLYSDFSDKTKD
jgi:ribA/ribD-fused uncharacterized protein